MKTHLSGDLPAAAWLLIEEFGREPVLLGGSHVAIGLGLAFYSMASRAEPASNAEAI